jgi:transposase
MQLPGIVFVATQPIDMRLSFDRIAGIVRAQLGREPRTDAVFVFHNRRLTHVKLLWHDGTGYRILFKRLDLQRSPEVTHPCSPEGTQRRSWNQRLVQQACGDCSV